jgi:hypothetical protein
MSLNLHLLRLFVADFVAEVAGRQGGTASSFFSNSLDLTAFPKRRRARAHRHPRILGLCNAHGGCWWWSGNQLSEPAQVLGDGSEVELVLRAARAT